MGQKINPHALRVGVIRDWDSRWFNLEEDRESIDTENSERVTKLSDSTVYSSD